MARRRRKPANPYAPKFWPTWMLVGVAWCITRLPLSWIHAIGVRAGRLVHRFGHSRRHITERNIYAMLWGTAIALTLITVIMMITTAWSVTGSDKARTSLPARSPFPATC